MPDYVVNCCTMSIECQNLISAYWEMPSTFMSSVVHKIVAGGSPADGRCEDLVWKEGVAKRFLDTLEIWFVATSELYRGLVDHTASRQCLDIEKRTFR